MSDLEDEHVELVVVGGSSAIAALAMARHSEGWQLSSIAAGVIMLFWIVGEVASIRGFHILQVVYFVTGAMVVWCTPRATAAPGQTRSGRQGETHEQTR